MEYIRADRTLYNALEQAPFFLVSLAMYSVVVDVKSAGYLSIAYAVTRCFYFSLYERPGPLVTFVTGPGYLIAAFMTFASLYGVFFF